MTRTIGFPWAKGLGTVKLGSLLEDFPCWSQGVSWAEFSREGCTGEELPSGSLRRQVFGAAV